jgi:ABC-type uncharacterized transport system permease subunit
LDEVVSTPASPAFYVALLCYLLATLGYLGAFWNIPVRFKRLAYLFLVVGFIAHGVDIGWRGVQSVHPGTSVREALGFLSWISVGGYLFWARREGFAVLGAFVAPISLMVLAAARLSPAGDALPGLTSLGRIHIATATIGVATFSLASAVALIYLLQERNLKRKKFAGALFKKSAALETLDKLSNQLVLIGFPIFTVSMTLGVIWVSQRSSGFARIEYPIALITWLSFGGLIVARTVRGWRGRRAAWLTLLGFSAALVVLAIYFLRRAL